MKTFIKKTLLFIVPLFVIGIGIEIMLRNVPNPYTFKRSIIEENLSEIKHLCLGSSVMNNGFDPSYFADSSFNFSFGGQWLRYNYSLLDKYIDSMPNLENILLGVCYRTMWEDELQPVTGETEDDMITYYNLYLNLTENTSWIHYSEFLSTGHLAFKKFTKHYISNKQTVMCDSLGLDHAKDGMKEDEKKYGELEDMVDKHTKYYYKSATEVYLRNIKYLEQIAQLCHENSVNLHIVIPPSLDEYCTLADSSQLQLMYSALDKIDEYKNNVYVHDYFSDNRFTDNDFYDGNHLRSSVGAIKFTKILSNDIL